MSSTDAAAKEANEIVVRLDAVIALLLKHTAKDDAMDALVVAGLDPAVVAKLVGTTANAVYIRKSRMKSRRGPKQNSRRK